MTELIFNSCAEHDITLLENVQYSDLLVITEAKKGTSAELNDAVNTEKGL